MRIATATANERATEAITRQQARLTELQGQLASGRRVNVPSDDPAGAAEAERVRARQARSDAEARLLDQAKTALSQADSTIGSSIDELQNAREALMAVQNGTYNASDRATYAAQLRSAAQSLLALANQPDGRGGYVFGGAGSTTPPFTNDGGTVTYTAQAGEQSSANALNLAMTQDGRSAFMSLPDGAGGVTSIFTQLENVAQALENPALDATQLQAAIGTSVRAVDGSMEQLSQMRTRVGESLRVIDARQSLNESDSVTLKARLGDLVDTDYAAAVSEFASTQTAVQAAMQTYAQVSKMSLFSYL